MRFLKVFIKKLQMHLNIRIVMAIWYMRGYLFREIKESFREIRGDGFISYVIYGTWYLLQGFKYDINFTKGI